MASYVPLLPLVATGCEKADQLRSIDETRWVVWTFLTSWAFNRRPGATNFGIVTPNHLSILPGRPERLQLVVVVRVDGVIFSLSPPMVNGEVGSVDDIDGLVVLSTDVEDDLTLRSEILQHD